MTKRQGDKGTGRQNPNDERREMVDKENMRKIIKNFPDQIEEGSRIGKDAKLSDFGRIENILISGMGGSAIGGDILRTLLFNSKFPVYVNRDYIIPSFIDKNSLAFIISYSGNTEETLSQYKKIKEKTKNVICISSDGELKKYKPSSFIQVPSGYQPRCALGYLFFSMLVSLSRIGIIRNMENDIKETISILQNLSKELDSREGISYKLAKKLLNKIPVVYSSNLFEPCARRWQTQLNENAKVFCHINLFSELNHNEIVGFGNPNLPSVTIILTDSGYSERILKRIKVTEEIIKPFTEIVEIKSFGISLLARLFSLIYIGDYTSYWLAILRGEDPTPVKRIDYLKERLKE